jgi:hypothetical protein
VAKIEALLHAFKLVLPVIRRPGTAVARPEVLELPEQFYEHVLQLVVIPSISTITCAEPGSALTAARSR